ncbi:MAG: hypothetical protein ICV78_01735 [Tolypothrix sp. Co-bin9]|nr:hypothetical protein [Tolypothrix sp. Co-bin9]
MARSARTKSDRQAIRPTVDSSGVYSPIAANPCSRCLQRERWSKTHRRRSPISRLRILPILYPVHMYTLGISFFLPPCNPSASPACLNG